MFEKRIKKRRIKRRILKVSMFMIVIIALLGFRNNLLDKTNRKIAYATSTIKSESKPTDSQREVSIVYEKKENILLVNRKNRLDENYLPKDLIIPNVRFISNGDPNVRKMSKVAAEALEKLFDGAKNENLTLLGVSGYRNYAYQENLYNNAVNRSGKEEADKYVAQPGASEHQTGLTMDMLSTEYTNLDEGFINTKAYDWLVENCYKYGFIIRYPQGKEEITGYNFEPWHLRYVGIDAATEIIHKNITLEEYLESTSINI